VAALRGPRPAPGMGGLKSALSDADAAGFNSLLDRLGAPAPPPRPPTAPPPASPRALSGAPRPFAPGRAARARRRGGGAPWAGGSFRANVRQAASGFAPLPGDRYPALLGNLLSMQVVRPRYGRHPRLAIWGPLEARLQHADLLVLGGLNEGTWPAEVTADPWL